jgi:hypothetical protein
VWHLRSLRSFNAGKTQEDFATHFPIATKINCRVAASAARRSERPLTIFAMIYNRCVLLLSLKP